MKQYQITTETMHEFVKKFVQPKLDFEITEIVKRDEVSKYSNNNYLWRIEVKTIQMEKKVLFVKLARAYNRRAWEIKRDKHYVDPMRICGEYQMMTLLAKLWGKEYVPEIYYFDPAQCVLVMSDVGRGGKLLVEEFAKGRLHLELGKLFGTLFGRLHSTTYNNKLDCCGSPAWRKVMMKFFGAGWIRQGIAKFVPRKDLKAFYKMAECAPRAWIWGDPVFRNIFVKPNRKVSMVDFDHAMSYDPASDCGMFLAHWMWMGLKSFRLKVGSDKFIEDFWKAYCAEFMKRELGGKVDAIMHRTQRWAGIYLVSRTDGRSGSYFKKWPGWERKIRKLGIALFLQKSSPDRA